MQTRRCWPASVTQTNGIVRNLAEGPYQKPVLAVLDNPDRQPYVAAIDEARH